MYFGNGELDLLSMGIGKIDEKGQSLNLAKSKPSTCPPWENDCGGG